MVITDPPQADQPADHVFSSESNDLFTKMLAAINLQPHQIFCTNICKCPGSAPPAKEEINCCLRHLRQQIAACAPKLILSMGSIASQTLLVSNHQLAALRGRVHKYMAIPLVATYHPDLLRQYPNLKKGAWYDLQLIQSRLNSGQSQRS